MTYLGVAAAAISGVMVARQKDMDIVGACTVAFITALGGGTLRDMLLGRLPVFWIQDQIFAILTLAVAVITFYSSRLLTLSSKSILVPDAIGLGIFSMLGTAYGIQAHTSLFVASLMGVTTGIFGGVLRDVICNEIPYVFARSAQLYATCSFVGSLVYILVIHLGFSPNSALLSGTLVVLFMRVIAVKYDLRLPDPL
jgi:uncharacterized membrane protein YeiH